MLLYFSVYILNSSLFIWRGIMVYVLYQMLVILFFNISLANATCLSIYPSQVGFCEDALNKDYHKEKVLDLGHFFNNKLSYTTLKHGNIYGGYSLYSEDELKENLSQFTDLVSKLDAKDALMTSFSGVFLTEDLPETFYTPEFQLRKDFVEKICRKMIVKKIFAHDHIMTHRVISHKVPLISNIVLKNSIKVAIFNYQTNLWSGHQNTRFLAKQNLEINNEVMKNFPDYQENYLILTKLKGKTGPIARCLFLTTIYASNTSDQKLFITRQFINIKTNYIVNYILKQRPGLIKKMMFRDFSKFVDTIRTVSEASHS